MADYLTRQQLAAVYPVTADYLSRLAQSGPKRRPGLPPAPPTIRLSARKIVYDRQAFEAWLADPWTYASNDPGPKRRGRPRKVE